MSRLLSPEPVTELLGAPELFIDAQSTINLTCVVRNSPEPPAFIFWKHNGNVSNHRATPCARQCAVVLPSVFVWGLSGSGTFLNVERYVLYLS